MLSLGTCSEGAVVSCLGFQGPRSALDTLGLQGLRRLLLVCPGCSEVLQGQ